MRHNRSRFYAVLSSPLSLAALWILCSGWSVAAAQPAADGYQKPSQALVDIVEAPTTPRVFLDPTRQTLALLAVPGLPSIDDLAQEELKLAGLRISPATRGPSRRRYLSSVAFQPLAGAPGSQTTVRGLPEDARLGNFAWSPDGKHLAFTHTRYGTSGSSKGRIELWVASVAAGEARRLGGELELTMSSFTPPAWLPDSSGLIALATPSGLPEAPQNAMVPIGPTIEESVGRKAPARTYQDLLKNADDERAFEFMMQAQVVEVSLVEAEAVRPLAEPAAYWDLKVSPSGEFLLGRDSAQAVFLPGSSLSIPTTDRSVESAVETGSSNSQIFLSKTKCRWRSAAFLLVRAPYPGAATWGRLWCGAEALDGGDAGIETDERDRLLQLAAPFESEPEVLATLGLRYSGTTWGNGQIAMVNEFWWKTRQTRSWQIAPDEPEADKRLLVDRSTEDRYNDPGRPLTRSNEQGQRVLNLVGDGDTVLLTGAGASPEGDRPFLDTQDLSSGETQRHLRSKAPHYELPIEVLEVDASGAPTVVLTRRESVEEPPNYYLRDLEAGTDRQLTDFEHPTPQLQGISKELIRYQREDGVELTATLYLPADFEAGGDPLPLLMWAYPIEYKSAAAASQVRGSPLRFDRIDHWSPMIFLAAGYAVLDNPTMPIIGEGDAEPNDTYVEQLVASARAAVEEVVRRRVADRDRIAIGGHSYGAFMTANLLAHSDLFAAGIARSGAYNRTLTPFGFQAEQRSFWEAPEVYFAMSPFMHAEKVNEPILLIHGEMDNNSGTFPMQSQRYFAALKGHGAVARLVMLPFESHGYRSRESLLHMLYEQEQWLESYVKSPAASGASTSGR